MIFTICENVKLISRGFATFTIRDATTAKVIYIGMSRTSHILALTDAKAAGLTEDRNVIVTINNLYNTEREANNARAAMIQSDGMPELNRNTVLSRHSPIECITTGETFDSAASAALAHNINPAALSQHLNNRTGYNSVKGKIYRRKHRFSV